MKKLLLIAIVVLGISTVSFGQSSVIGTANSSATIITPLTITSDIPLAFGNIAVHATDPGTVTITTAGGINNDGGTTIPAIAGTHSAANFKLEGEPNSTIDIVVPGDDLVTIKREGGTETMELNGFENSSLLKLGADGKASFQVGAILSVDGGQVQGSYKGTFEVTVNYN